MRLYDMNQRQWYEEDALPPHWEEREAFFLLCDTGEIERVTERFGFDESTVLECTDLDESVRYASFDGYDFVSLVHMERVDADVAFYELNIYVSRRYVVLVMPTARTNGLDALEASILAALTGNGGLRNAARAAYAIYDRLLAAQSDVLEALEDMAQALQLEIIEHVQRGQFVRIGAFIQTAYNVKKHLRAVSYIGALMLIDENHLLSKPDERYYRTFDTRSKKLYDLAETLYEFCHQLLYAYDGRLTMKTNDLVTKLTVITVFFGPLTVITGIYGMNFDFMPELHAPMGYPMALAAMALVSAGIFALAKWRKWL